ncbi:hypothetical protein J2W49_004179 [Hydrogenophaga palleronii]|uniref:Peptidase M48 domain-containing protein n=1 Tax=Hydrogenophaga palleronii TaxID=65655 RepID=A0ABU1WSG1_9BURK|nr:hypothetical protein [Hydrogenophaga palleronii]MDR7152203.1 hypothetical protein [Hydrogenophaga palleronii]
MPNTSPPSIPESVFSSQFRQQPSFPAILEQAHASPFLVDMLTQLHARGNQIHVDALTTRAAYYQTETGDIYIGSALFPAVNDEGRPIGVTELKRFVSLLGHEGGHAVLQDHGHHPRSPDDARALGLAGEGVALAAEYIVASQMSGPMWSGRTIQDSLEATAASLSKSADIATRRMSDPAAQWQAFDAQAAQQGAAYYGQLSPSTAPNITYNEYYAEAWAVLNTRDGRTLQQHIDWDRVQSPDIVIVPHADGAFTLVGQAVPMDSGPHAGRRVDFSAAFDADSRVAGETRQTPRPATLSTHENPPGVNRHEHVTREPADLHRNPEASPPEQGAMPLLSEQHMRWLRQAYVELAPALKAQGLDPDRSLQVAAACLHTAARHEARWGAPRQFLLSNDGCTGGPAARELAPGNLPAGTGPGHAGHRVTEGHRTVAAGEAGEAPCRSES